MRPNSEAEDLTIPKQSPLIRVLLVEKNQEDFVTTSDLLGKIGPERFELEQVSSYEQGIEAVATKEYDICLVSCCLGQQNGLEFLAKATSRNYRVPIILLSNAADDVHYSQAIWAGAADHLIKGQIKATMLERAILHAIERKKMKETIKNSENIFKAIFENAGGAIFIADIATGEILDCNLQAQKLIGRTHDEIVGMHQSKLHPPEEAELYKEKFAFHVKHGHIADYEGEIQTRNGQKVPVGINAQVAEIGGKEVIVGLFLDITEQKQAEKTLREAKEHAEQARAESEDINKRLQVSIEQTRLMAEQALQANQIKTNFLANMSHEIRTPLHGIIGFGELLNEEIVDESQQEYVQMILNCGRDLLELINDILDLSKVEAGKMEIHIQDCPIEKILTNIWTLLQPKVEEKQIEFSVRYVDSLPAVIRTDSTRLRQCLLNLIDNAVKFTHQGHVFVNVSMQKHKNENFICFAVEDTGIGISADQQANIFDAFTQADETTTRKFEGTGLGLTITQQMARCLGGRISVCSEKDKGSTFSLIIPSGIKESDNVEMCRIPNKEFKPAKMKIACE